ALLVQKIIADLHRKLGDDLRGALLARFLAHEPENRQCQRLHAAHVAGAVASRAHGLRRLLERGSQPLPRQLEQPEAGNAADLNSSPVLTHGIAQPVLDLTLVAARSHIDEVDDDQTAEIADPKLSNDFVRSLKVRVEGGVLEVLALGG